jgi:hypothetical protein
MTNKTTDSKQTSLTSEEIDELVLTEYPYPIARNYRKVLDAKDWEKRTREIIKVFEYGMRAITLGILSQYLIEDLYEFSDPELNRELYKQKLSKVSLGTWVNYFFLALKAYGGKRNLFFMRELYDLYWDASHTPNQPRKGVRGPFDRLVEIRNDLVHRIEPNDESGWEKLGKEALEKLREVMKRFHFLQNYDLIRVVKPVDKEYEYERFTGQEITHYRENLKHIAHDQEKLKHKGKIQPDWFYLSRQDQTILGLHPLLIFWTNTEEENWIEGNQPEEHDVAVFEKLLTDAAEFIVTVFRKVIKEDDATLVSQLRDLINYNLEQVKMAIQRSKLSWEVVQDAIQKISSEQMESAQKKYNHKLYLQRDAVYKKFEDFMSSDKTCFVLTGKSGVGKSNFVLSLAETLASDEHITVLMYNGARLDVSSTGVVEKISQDLSNLVQLQGDALKNVFAAIDKSKDMSNRKLLVIFDAINENTDPREVLKRIDQMVGQERYLWLKVLITSRPEGWRAMKRGLPLAEDRYYKEKGSEDVSIELQEFTVKLDIFERDELQAVYSKYYWVFDLKTEYAALKAAVRNVLRDPLVLRLVADIHRGKSIPDQIQVNDIYKSYVDNLINTRRLDIKDIILLEQELMPLMLKRGFYENKLTASQIETATTRDGRPLWELIHSDDTLGSGQRVNASYMRLRDTELLDASGMGREYVIGFKYERFYEFFGGKRLYQAAGEYAGIQRG